jgi:ABC-2 type transport system ATP-binding protein
MISLQNVSARRAPLALTSVNLEWGPGVHSIVGRREDGGALLLALVAGVALPRAGHVRILERSPADARKEIARIPLEPSLPDTLRVDELLRLACRLRSEALHDSTARLATLGVEPLARRKVRSLSRGEARAVSLVEALTSTRVRVVLVEEPGTWMDPRAAGRLPQALQDKAQTGAAIVLTTASPRDANELAIDHVVLHRGAVVSGPTSSDPRLSELNRARLVVVSRDEAGARLLAAGLARDPCVAGLGQEGVIVRVRGDDAVDLARATARAAVAAGAEIVELRWESDETAHGGSPWTERPGAMEGSRGRRAQQKSATGSLAGAEGEQAS